MIPLLFIVGLNCILLGVTLLHNSVTYVDDRSGGVYIERNFMMAFSGIGLIAAGGGAVLGIIVHMASVAIL